MKDVGVGMKIRQRKGRIYKWLENIQIEMMLGGRERGRHVKEDKWNIKITRRMENGRRKCYVMNGLQKESLKQSKEIMNDLR